MTKCALRRASGSAGTRWLGIALGAVFGSAIGAVLGTGGFGCLLTFAPCVERMRH